ncbi:type B 50S ribosomal protein L31 [Puniceicoccus vermicola]|uniref:50S ribosomal protein L31 n=1 Tax=Puniceicoccus vermicola TaxID=388746 RepID=A0A7X1B1S3_9BACT|nr:type B 50S ribosomal protein L31 [Puniceicoccus vermicola]MBC2604045.1 type B 50S ribosomal protein L31 [Puniceicoccus vermicola]
MKKDIHPDYTPTCFVDVSTGNRFMTHSTVKADRREDIDGVEYKMIICDITSDSHPVFTGEKRFVDTAGRVEKFQNKFRRGRR